MEDNNNKLGDFFRKRLSSLEGGDEDWFNPDPRMDNLVVKELSAISERKRNKKRWLLLFLPCLLFLGMLAYIIYLKNHIATLDHVPSKTIVQYIPVNSNSNSNKNDNNTPNISTIPPSNSTPSSVNKANIERKKLQQAIRNLQSQNKNLQQVIRKKDKTIHSLQIELEQNCSKPNLFAKRGEKIKDIESSSFFPQLSSQLITTAENSPVLNSNSFLQKNEFNHYSLSNAEMKMVLHQNFQDLATIQPNFLAIELKKEEPIGNYSFKLKNRKKRKLNSFEIGLQLGLHTLLTEKKVDISNQRIIDSRAIEERFIVPYLGVNFAYSPYKNFWIRIAVRGGINTDYRGQKMGIVYNDAQEYTLPSGAAGSDFVLNSSTGYTTIKNTLALILPNTTANGDLFELEYQEELKTTHLQIPLTFEYFFGSKRWQPFIHVGLKWNRFHYEYITSGLNLVSKDQSINFDIKEGEGNTRTLEYMSLLTGVGLNWNIRPQLSLRTTLGVEGNFILNEPKKTGINYTTNGLSADFGLYYKF